MLFSSILLHRFLVYLLLFPSTKLYKVYPNIEFLFTKYNYLSMQHVDEVQGIVEFIHAAKRLKSAGGSRRK